MTSYTQSRPVTARQITFQSADKTKVLSGKIVYPDGFHLQHDPTENVYFIVMPVNGTAVKVRENYWLVIDTATGQQQIWDPTSFAAQHA